MTRDRVVEGMLRRAPGRVYFLFDYSQIWRPHCVLVASLRLTNPSLPSQSPSAHFARFPFPTQLSLWPLLPSSLSSFHILPYLSSNMSRSGPYRGDPPPFEPLPNNVFSRRTHLSWHDAYARCVGLFFWAVGRQPPPGTPSYDMCSRVLGHLVLEAPTELGRDWVCRRILGCADEHALVRLAQKYIFTFVAACASSTSHRPRRRL